MIVLLSNAMTSNLDNMGLLPYSDMHIYCKLRLPDSDGPRFPDKSQHSYRNTYERDRHCNVSTTTTFDWHRPDSEVFHWSYYRQSRERRWADLRTKWFEGRRERVWGQSMLWRRGSMTRENQFLYYRATIADGKLINVTPIRSSNHVTTIRQLLQ